MQTTLCRPPSNAQPLSARTGRTTEARRLLSTLSPRARGLLFIHDYGTLNTLAGRAMKGYYACVHCDKDLCSRRLKKKICYNGHRRFLPPNHLWRRKRIDFDSNPKNHERLVQFTIEELLQQLENIEDVKPGNQERKRESTQHPQLGVPGQISAGSG